MPYQTVDDEARELRDALQEETGKLCDLDALATQVRRARKLNRINERWCNEEMSERAEQRLRKEEESIEQRITAYFDALNQETGAAVEVHFNGDPRGYPVKVVLPKSRRYNTWGGAETGWGFGSA